MHAAGLSRLCAGCFFQAEDGIRDHCVTGVQTCALPIFIVHGGVAARDRLELVEEVQHDFAQRHLIGEHHLAAVVLHVDRSEEHTSELQSHSDLVCRLLLEKKKYSRSRSTTESVDTATML